MIDSITYGLTNQMTDQVEYGGYDPVVSAVRGRRRAGFRSRSVINPSALYNYTVFRSDAVPVRSVPEWCRAVGRYDANVCRAIEDESRFIADHEPAADPSENPDVRLASYPGKRPAYLYSYLDGRPDRAPVRYTRCMRCPLNDRRNYNLVIQSTFRAVNNYINTMNAVGTGGKIKLCDIYDGKLTPAALTITSFGSSAFGSPIRWRRQRLNGGETA